MATSSEVWALGSSSMAQRAETTWEAVCTQRRKGETKTRWIGNPRLVRSFRPMEKARTWPASTSGGSHGLAAVVTHDGTKLSMRSPCRITTMFWWSRRAGAPADAMKLFVQGTGRDKRERNECSLVSASMLGRGHFYKLREKERFKMTVED